MRLPVMKGAGVLSALLLGIVVVTAPAFATPDHANDEQSHATSASEQGATQSSQSSEHNSGEDTEPQPASQGDFSGHGANQHGAYDSTRDGSPSENGVGEGEAVGKPCAGCVGRADNKNPQGQNPDTGVDDNAGYECDRNEGIGQTNPAHTGCVTTQPLGETTPPTDGGAPTRTDAEVLGVTFTAPAAPRPVSAVAASAASAPPAVLGVSETRSGAESLAATGTSGFGAIGAIGLTLILAGSLITRASRRTAPAQAN